MEYGTTLTIPDVADVTDDHPGVDAVFQQSNSLNGTIGEDGKSVTFSRPGEYSVTISATDAKGNHAEMECPVSVVDTTSPVIRSIAGVETIGYGETLTLTGSPNIPNSIAVECDDVSAVSLSISSVQAVGSEPSNGSSIQHTGDSVTFSNIGDHILTIAATDQFGNSSDTQVNVSVVDLTRPTISGLDRIRITDHDALPSFIKGVAATDEIDGDLTQKMTVDFSAVKKGVPGSYDVVYSVSDSAGNTAEENRVVLIEDITPPTIKLSRSSVSLTVGNDEPDYKSLVSAHDAADGDLSSKIKIDDSSVDPSKPGTYTVKYSVTDRSGNSASKTLKVVVKAKAAAPSNSGGGGSSGGSGSSGSSGGSGGGTVYITRTGAKYHLGGCRYLSRSKISISRSSAIARGYTPCSVCRP